MQQTELEPKILELLRKRGVETEEDIREFLSEKPQKTYDPFLMKDMDQGVDMLLSAVDDGRKICIYGDYDADGVTSVTILWEVLSQLTEEGQLMYYIPSRFGEGYGLNCAAVEKLRKEEDVDFIVTVDCGSVSVEEVEYAHSLGMTVLVTDHHTVKDRVPDCPVINPAQPDCSYPCEFLAGCGVAFKLAQALVQVTGLPKRVLTRTLDLVGIGTIGDIVPLLDENRTLAKYGLRAINTRARKNLDILVRAAGLTPGHVTAENVSFVIVPHINAAGRMQHARIAARLFMAGTEEEAQACAAELVKCNRERKDAQNRIYRECVGRVEEDLRSDPFLVVDLDDANEGVTGIAAGKLKDRYYRPAVIVTPIGDGKYKGTGRSVDGINLYDMLKENEDLFTAFGGHAAACGFTLKAGAVRTLRENLNRQAAALKEAHPELWVRTVTPDLELSDREVTPRLAEQMNLLEPCGCRNERPLVEITVYADGIRRMGKENQYLRFHGELEGMRRVSCVVFQGADRIERTLQEAGSGKVRVTGSLRNRMWNGRTFLEMQVAAVRSAF